METIAINDNAAQFFGIGFCSNPVSTIDRKKEQYFTRILELVAQNKAEATKLVKTIECKARGVVFARAVFDKTLRQIYLSRGYTFLDEGHSVFMVKPLETGTPFKQVYGGFLPNTTRPLLGRLQTAKFKPLARARRKEERRVLIDR